MAITVDVAHRIPAGWYPVREDRSRRRWWNGVEWTEYYSANPDTEAPVAQLHSIRGAVTLKDRVAAFTLAGLLIANLILIAVAAKLI